MKPLQSLVVLLLAVAIGVVAAQWLGADDLNRFGEVTLRYGGYDYHSHPPEGAPLSGDALLGLWLLWGPVAAPVRARGRPRRQQGRGSPADGPPAHPRGPSRRGVLYTHYA
ncbi:hypothetical protein J6396_31635, partial [Pseudomonas aeruginosa]|nr:hypothetical protein [Pseudomonas aeruginosa]